MNNKKKNVIEKIMDKQCEYIFCIVSVAVILMFLLIILQVIFRYILNFSLYWIEEAARYLMIFIAVFGVSLAFKNDINPTIDILNINNKRIKLLLTLTLRIFLVIFLVIFIYYGYIYAIRNLIFSTPGLRISFFWPYLIIPVGGLTIFILLMLDIINIVIYKRTYMKR
jgi:TRAP-type transport system small permease protein